MVGKRDIVLFKYEDGVSAAVALPGRQLGELVVTDLFAPFDTCCL
jgi:hypothetical protein